MKWLALAGLGRSEPLDIELGAVLAFVAGAANAGGFLALGHYTSHMTGMVSAMTDHLTLMKITAVLAMMSAVLSFVAGAMVCSWMVNWARRRGLHSAYSLPLLLEAAVLLVFGLWGASISPESVIFLSLGVVLLCFLMGLQNALMTKISKRAIRTTHLTGVLTDIGIELGKLGKLNDHHRLPDAPAIQAGRHRLKMNLAIFMSFLMGGVLGSLGFRYLGFVTTAPMAFILILLGIPHLLADFRAQA